MRLPSTDTQADQRILSASPAQKAGQSIGVSPPPHQRQDWARVVAYLRLSRTYRRILLNAWLSQWQQRLQGLVLDIGAEKGSQVAYTFPEAKGARKWLSLNIDPAKTPHIVADAACIPLAMQTVDTVICMETMEHVGDPWQLVQEFARVLRPTGTLILSVPFLYRIHSRPNDFWRFTEHGVWRLLQESGLDIVQIEPLGRFCTVVCDLIKQGISEIRVASLRWLLGLLFLPWAALLVELERRGLGKQSLAWSSFATGYAVLATRSCSCLSGTKYQEAGVQ